MYEKAKKEIRVKIKKIFDSLIFPMQRKDIIEHARREGKSDDIVDAMSRLPDRIYKDYRDLLREFDTLPVKPGHPGKESHKLEK